MLMDHGFERVRPLLGGLEGWVAAGYQVEEHGLIIIEPAV